MTIRNLLVGGIALLPLHLSLVDTVSATVITEWITVGDPGNAEHTKEQADGTSGYGRVDYEYRIAKYEVTNAQYAEFLNAVAATDTYELYLPLMGSTAWGGIRRSGSSGNYTYSLKPNMANKPVNYVSWHDGARFTNWLHNGQPVGMQDASTTEEGAYTFAGLETPAPRNPGAQVFMPSEHEWHKAAFYEPGAVTDDRDEWWYYGTGSDIQPGQAVATPTGGVRNPGPMVVNYYHGAGWNGQIYGNVVDVGAAGSSSYYGAMDMVGNVFEWTTADPSKPDPHHVGPYIVRGASFFNSPAHIRNTERNLGPKPDGGGHVHSNVSRNNGFRVASYLPAVAIPEPSTLVLIAMGILGVATLRRRAGVITVVLAALSLLPFAGHAAADTFGSGLNEFDIEFVTIGDPGNAPDTSSDANPDLPGSVPYGYRIGKYEISEEMVSKANAEGGLGIQKDSRGPDKPATDISWIEALRFVNWMNTNTGSQPAYKFDGSNFALWRPNDTGYDPANPYRNTEAKYFLPSADEWYKAAFFDPATGDYYDYATGSNNVPVSVDFGTFPNTAVYGRNSQTTPPADITQAGGLSPFGTMAQSGNVFELEETDFDMVNDAVSSPRGVRGGSWGWYVTSPGFLSRTYRNSVNPKSEITVVGFRVAATTLPADFDLNGYVDGDDFLIWQSNFPTLSGATSMTGDANGDGAVNGHDFLVWQAMYSVPEPPPSADFDLSGIVDGADFLIWQSNYPTAAGATQMTGDANGDGAVNGHDFLAWQAAYAGSGSAGGAVASAVPEPASLLLVTAGLIAISACRSRRPRTVL